MTGVAFALPNLRLGGQAELVRSASAEAKRRGIQVTEVLPPGVALEDREHLDRYRRETGLIGRLRHILAIRGRLARLGPEARPWIVVPAPSLVPLALWLAPSGPLVVHFEHSGSDFSSVPREIMEGVSANAFRMLLTHRTVSFGGRNDRIVMVAGTAAAARRLRAQSPRATVFHLAQACDWDPPFPDRADARSRLGLPEGVPVVGYAGHLFATKGLPTLLTAFTALRARMPQVVLAIAASGEGSVPTGMPKGVRLLGILDIPRFLRAIDVLALPYLSLSSTTLPPSLLLEALAVGVPVVTSALPDLQELATEDEVTFSPAGDASELADALKDVLDRRDDRDALTVRQRQRTLAIRAERASSALWDHLASPWWS